jgi:hypothetical protein
MKNERQPINLTALGALPALRGLAKDRGGHLHQRSPARSAVATDHGHRRATASRRYSWDNTLLRTSPVRAVILSGALAQGKDGYAGACGRGGRCVG